MLKTTSLRRIPALLFQHGPLRAFASPQFRLLWGGSFLAIVSFFAVLIARGWLVLEMTDSPLLVTAVNAVPMIPMTLFPIFGGVIADRLNRRLVLICSDLANCAVLLGMAALLFTGAIQVWHVFALALVHGAIFSMGMPARAAIVPDVVSSKDMASGIALYTTIFSAAQLIAPAPAGFIIEALGMTVTFLIASLVLLPAVAVLLPMRVKAQAPAPGAPRETVLGSVLSGFRYTRGHPVLLGLMFMGLVFALFGMPSFQALMPVFARDVHLTGADGLGLLGAAMGVGALTGSVIVASFSKMRQLRVLLLVGFFSYGAFMVLFALAPSFGAALVLTGLIGLAMQLAMTSNFTVLQVTAPPHLRGRVMSIRMVVMGASPVGMLSLGAVTEAIGPVAAMAGVGTFALGLTALVLLLVPALRRVNAPEPADGEKPETAPAPSSG